MEKSTFDKVSVGTLTSAERLTKAFREAKEAEELTVRKEIQLQTELDRALDRIVEIQALMAPFEKEEKNLRNTFKAEMPKPGPGDKVRHVSSTGNVGLAYWVQGAPSFSRSRLMQMISEAQTSGDSRKAKTLTDVLTTCYVEPVPALAFKINP